MKKLNLGVREHSPSAATTSQITSAQEVCDPLLAATGSPHSVLFGACILLRPFCKLFCAMLAKFQVTPLRL